MKPFYFYFILILLFGSCQKSKHTEPLQKTVYFDTYGKVQLGLIKSGLVDTAFWENHMQDSLIYFKIKFKELEPKVLVVKTDLVANRMPFLVKYNKISEQNSVLEIVQQFNTVYSDSIILSTNSKNKTIEVKEIYKVVYPHNFPPEVRSVPVRFSNDTLDIRD